MIYQRVVGNLGSSTDLGVDTLEALTDTGVDLKVHIDTGVDLEVHIDTGVGLEVHIASGVDLEECTVP